MPPNGTSITGYIVTIDGGSFMSGGPEFPAGGTTRTEVRLSQSGDFTAKYSVRCGDQQSPRLGCAHRADPVASDTAGVHTARALSTRTQQNHENEGGVLRDDDHARHGRSLPGR